MAEPVRPGAMDGRVTVVTGGAAGVGRALAIAYARAGAHVLIADRADAGETVAEIEAAGGVARAVRCDISREEDVASLAGAAETMFGGVDVLVNNAGISPVGTLDADPAEWDRVFAINVRGTFLVTRALVPLMRKRGGGKIINLASALFFAAAPAMTAYIASKGAIIGFTRALARELGADNIQVNALAPGMIDTPGVLALNLPSEAIQAFTRGQCLPRRETAEDLVGAAILLASAASDFMTGQVLVVDGGFVLH